ncbi:MAG: aspartate/glutamate racemase family protein [Candidatus Dormiibacterota bacterium]
MRLVYIVPGPMSQTALGAPELERRVTKLRSWAAPGASVDIREVARGPASIESVFEEFLSVPATADQMLAAERDGYDAAILGCFGDPGVDAFRELLTGMVVAAPGEAAFHLASLLGERFGIVTVTSSIVNPLRHLVARYGLADRLAGIAVVDTPVLELAQDASRTLARIRDAGRRLIEEHGADTLVLGCMSMAFMEATAELASDLGVPVVNPARSALKVAEAIVGSGLRHSKRAYPLPPKLAGGAAGDAAGLLIG